MSAFDQEELDIDEYGEMAAAQVQEDPVVRIQVWGSIVCCASSNTACRR